MGMGGRIGGAASGAATGAAFGPWGAVAGGALGFILGGGGDSAPAPPPPQSKINSDLAARMASDEQKNSAAWKAYEQDIGGYDKYQPPEAGGAPVWQPPSDNAYSAGRGMGKSAFDYGASAMQNHDATQMDDDVLRIKGM